ncbi:AsmA family protein [Neolewinella persica]|uniref:DUF748 domain-containing protein n=1 Tax=Neolewinella persica TaxID=70998 RepID=UPI000371EF5A|nr:DUF748 domain-containing protein [Neolewinella persica]
MKKFIYSAGSLLVLLLAIYFGGKAFANGKLNDLIEKSNQNGNTFTVGARNLSFSFLNLGLKLDSVRLDQAVGSRRVFGTIRHLNLNGLSAMKVISGDVSINDLLVDGAALEVHYAIPDSTDASTELKTKKKGVNIKNLRLANGHVLVFDKDSVLKAEVLGLSTSGSIDLPLAPASPPKMNITADSIFFPATDDTNETISGLRVDTGKKNLNVGTFRLSPKQTTKAFLTSIKYKRPWQALRVDNIEIVGIPFDSLMAGGRSVIPDVNISDLNFAIYENPSLERDPSEPYKNFPVENFRKLGKSILLQSLTVDRANISYGAHKNGTDKPDITFAGTIKAGNFSTWKQDDPAFVQGDFTFDETSPLTIRFELGQASEGRDFRATGDLKNYDLPKVNPLMEVAANADIEKGYISHMTHDFNVRNDVSEGEMVLKYDHLELKMTGKGAWFTNLIEDIAVRDSNPRNDGDLVVGSVYAEHEPTKSFFNLYWKSVVAGMTSSAVGKVFTPDELAPKD